MTESDRDQGRPDQRLTNDQRLTYASTDAPAWLADRVAAAVSRRESDRAIRQQFATRRQAGKAARHRDREKLMTTPTRKVTCRYLRRSGEQCTAEAVDPQGDVLLCTKHLARAMRLVQITLPVRSATDGRTR